MRCEPPPITFIPCEEHFRPVLPTIEGNVDYLALGGQVGALSFDGQEDVFDLVRIAITFADTPESPQLWSKRRRLHAGKFACPV